MQISHGMNKNNSFYFWQPNNKSKWQAQKMMTMIIFQFCIFLSGVKIKD